MTDQDKTTKKTIHEKPSLASKLVDLLPMLIMFALGAVIMGYLGWIWILAYLAYGVISLLWFMRFICTACATGKRSQCPSGMGDIAFTLFGKQRPARRFRQQFKRHIGVLFPNWFVPPIVAIYLLIVSFDLVLLFVGIVFCLVAFVLLPVASSKKSCDHCVMKNDCPWARNTNKN